MDALTADFRAIYGLRFADYVALPSGEAVHEALVFVEHLTNRPDSHYAAALAGGSQFFGWDADRYLAADLRDFMLAVVAGLGGKKISDADLFPRPEREPERARTVADFDIDAFARRLAGR